jgi:hypothetical protein
MINLIGPQGKTDCILNKTVKASAFCHQNVITTGHNKMVSRDTNWEVTGNFVPLLSYWPKTKYLVTASVLKPQW